MKHRICTIEGCGKKHFGLGYCKMHYTRWTRHGVVHYPSHEELGKRYRNACGNPDMMRRLIAERAFAESFRRSTRR